MKRVDARKPGDYKFSEIAWNKAGLKTLLVNMADDKSTHNKKQINHKVPFG